MVTDTTNSNRRWEAATKGLVKFEAVAPCERCGCQERYVLANQCVQCTKDRARRNTDELRAALKKARGRKGR